MKLTSFKVIIFLVIIVLVCGFAIEFSFATDHPVCSCCNNKCQTANKCQDKARVCVCSRQLNVQPLVFISDAAYLCKLTFLDYLILRTDSAYLYLPNQDIFHPPKA